MPFPKQLIGKENVRQVGNATLHFPIWGQETAASSRGRMLSAAGRKAARKAEALRTVAGVAQWPGRPMVRATLAAEGQPQ